MGEAYRAQQPFRFEHAMRPADQRRDVFAAEQIENVVGEKSVGAFGTQVEAHRTVGLDDLPATPELREPLGRQIRHRGADVEAYVGRVRGQMARQETLSDSAGAASKLDHVVR